MSQLVGGVVILVGVFLGVFLILHGLGVFPGLSAVSGGTNSLVIYTLGLVFSVILIATGMTALRKGST